MLSPLRCFACACICLVTLATAPRPFAQDVQMVPDKQDRESAERAQSHKEENDEPVTTFKARSDVVQLFFNVKDKKGGLIPNLPKDNFDVLENGKPQLIK